MKLLKSCQGRDGDSCGGTLKRAADTANGEMQDELLGRPMGSVLMPPNSRSNRGFSGLQWVNSAVNNRNKAKVGRGQGEAATDS